MALAPECRVHPVSHDWRVSRHSYAPLSVVFKNDKNSLQQASIEPLGRTSLSIQHRIVMKPCHRQLLTSSGIAKLPSSWHFRSCAGERLRDRSDYLPTLLLLALKLQVWLGSLDSSNSTSAVPALHNSCKHIRVVKTTKALPLTP